ncbi:fimbrial protein [Enterobacter sp. 22466]|uniref:fimbrial protein n=1 Tax=Enterobacter sp. 22466 TaxID=3453924 RepID=UPI003F861DEF
MHNCKSNNVITTPTRRGLIIGGSLMGLSLLATLVGSQAANAEANNNLQFDGTLVATPCTLDPDTTTIQLDFGTVSDKYLYINTRTHSKPFSIRLLDCDLTLGKSVVFTFTGTPDKELPELLGLASKPASGIAIGMEQADGTALPINKATPAYQLMTGDNTFTFKGYVQGEPSALQKHSIGRGDFSATATFTLDYP